MSKAWTALNLEGSGLQSANLRLAALAAGALYDLFRTDDAVARINKRLRMQIYLSQTSGAPQGFKGHYSDKPDGNQ